MLYAIVALLVIILDQWTKFWVAGNIALNTGSRELIPGLIKLVNIHNDGAALGFLSGKNAGMFFIILCAVFTIFVIVALATRLIKSSVGRWSLLFIMAGGLSNCIDRIISGYVQDMFMPTFMDNLPIFNVADIFITVFCLVFILFVLFGGRSDDSDEDEDEDEDEHHHHEHHHEHDDEDEDEHEHHHDHHDHDDEDEHEHEHHHDHDHHHEHEHHHDHEHHHHHHGHDADEVFDNIGVETAKRFTEDGLREALGKLTDEEEYGSILRAKGIVQAEDGRWLHFDYVPGETEIRYGSADYTGRLCVIGTHIDESALHQLFGV